MKTIDDLLEHVKTLKEEPIVKDEFLFSDIGINVNGNTWKGIIAGGRASGRSEISMIEQMRSLQQEYMETMHKLHNLAEIELTKIKNDK
jgi:hypothetical protein